MRLSAARKCPNLRHKPMNIKLHTVQLLDDIKREADLIQNLSSNFAFATFQFLIAVNIKSTD